MRYPPNVDIRSPAIRPSLTRALSLITVITDGGLEPAQVVSSDHAGHDESGSDRLRGNEHCVDLRMNAQWPDNITQLVIKRRIGHHMNGQGRGQTYAVSDKGDLLRGAKSC